MKSKIKVVNTVKYYESFAAVKNISFDVFEGEIFGLLGPNGAGKTTTLRMISGILQPSEGEIFINGSQMNKETILAKKNLGFQTGDMNLYERLTPIELLDYFANLYSVPKNKIKDRIDELVTKFQINEFANKLCGKLSTGQKQRVTIARTIIHNPGVLVLDEPTTGLDIMSSELILGFMKTAREEDNKTIIFSTHNLSEVERLSNRIGIIHKGELIVTGTINEINSAAGKDNLTNSFFKLVNTH